MRGVWSLVLLLVLGLPMAGYGQSFDPYLSQKAADYEAFLRTWHSTGLGGVSDILFTDETRQEIYRTWGAGDSGDWTGTYLATQAMRYIITGEEAARDEVLRIAYYMHQLKEVTGDPGYLARYVAPDLPPWNVEFEGSDRKYPGEGEYEGYFWVGQNVRDKYITWFWGLTWAVDAVDDPDLYAMVRQDFIDVIQTLKANHWYIIDPWGEIYSAAHIMPDIRLAILLQAAHVIDEPEYWNLLDQEYEKVKNALWLTSFAGFNKYMDYYAFINNYSFAQPLFRLWPDRERFAHLRRVWEFNVRRWSKDTHNAFFDATYYAICLRHGECDQAELDAIAADVYHGLTVMWEAPNYQRAVTCSTLPLDPFSVWADQFLLEHPWIGELTGIDIDVQTAVAHEVDDRCWESVLWERSPYHVACEVEDDPAHTAHGVDYLIGYWLGVFYGLLPGGGPYGDDDLLDDDDDNDDDNNDNDNDDNDNNDNDDNSDDDNDDNDNDTTGESGDADDNGCGC